MLDHVFKERQLTGCADKNKKIYNIECDVNFHPPVIGWPRKKSLHLTKCWIQFIV